MSVPKLRKLKSLKSSGGESSSTQLSMQAQQNASHTRVRMHEAKLEGNASYIMI